MAADTKRGAVSSRFKPFTHENRSAMVHIHNMNGKSRLRVSIADLVEFLDTQGQHVVTAADKVVLDAWSAVPTETLWLWANHMSAHVRNTCRAEIARRGLK